MNAAAVRRRRRKEERDVVGVVFGVNVVVMVLVEDQRARLGAEDEFHVGMNPP